MKIIKVLFVCSLLFVFLTAIVSYADIPSAFDWRNYQGHNWVTPVRNQNTCSAPESFGAIGIIESQIMINTGNYTLMPDLSEQQIISCDVGNEGCNGGSGQTALDYIQTNGVVYQDAFPYTSTYSTCLTNINSIMPRAKISGYFIVNNNVSAIKKAIATNGPLMVYMTVYSDFFSYNSGIYSYITGYNEGVQIVILVGYNDSGQYWIAKNDWGTLWGENGYFRTSYSNNTFLFNYGVFGINKTDYNGDGIWDAKPWTCNGILYTDTSVCQGKGTCIAQDSCICNSGWTGVNCSTPVCSPSCNKGTCTGPNTCTCQIGWGGNLCQYFDYTLNLYPNWNLISIPIIPKNDSISSMITNCNYNNIWSYNNVNKSWISMNTGLASIDAGNGYYIDRNNFSDNCSINILGILSNNTQINLVSGWNLVGYSSLNVTLVSNINISMYNVWSYDSQNGWISIDTGLNTFVPGNGYWIDAK